jgi:CSLREA domain-containing protein
MRRFLTARTAVDRGEGRSTRLVPVLFAACLTLVLAFPGGRTASAAEPAPGLGPEDVPFCPGGAYPEPLFTPNCRIAATSGPLSLGGNDFTEGQVIQPRVSGVDAVPCYRAPAGTPVCSSLVLQNIRFYNPNSAPTARSTGLNSWQAVSLDPKPVPGPLTHGWNDCLDACTVTARYWFVDNNLPGSCKGKPAAECTDPAVKFGPLLMIAQWQIRLLTSSGQVTQQWVWEDVYRFTNGITGPSVDRPPAASFTWRAADEDPLTVSFDGSGSSDDKGVVSYAWEIEGATATGVTPPPHTFSASGTYPVKLTVTDAAGQSNSRTIDVKVPDCPQGENCDLLLTAAGQAPRAEGARRGEQIRYTLDARVLAAGSVGQLTVSAAVPTALVVVDTQSISPGGTVSADGGTVEWALSGVKRTDPPLSFAVRLRSDLPGSTLFVSTNVHAHARLGSGSELDASKLVQTPVLQTRLSVGGEIVAADGEARVDPGDTATVRVQADAGATVDELVLEAVVPLGSKLVAGSVIGGGTVTGSTIRWRFTNVGQTPIVAFDVKVDALDDLPGDLRRLESKATARATVDGVEDSVEQTFSIDLRRQAGLVVNSTGDAPDEATADDVCFTGANVARDGGEEAECTLRAAIQQANASPGADTIRFDIPGGAPTIVPRSGLPFVGGGVTIDGTTQPGGWVGLGDMGLVLEGTANVVRGVAFTGGGILVRGSGHLISGNRFGVTATGQTAANLSSAIDTQDATDVTIGGEAGTPGSAPGNLIRVRNAGLSIRGGRNIRVQGNLVEGAVGGPPEVGIGLDGVAGAEIGGPTAQAGNAISARRGLVVARTVSDGPVRIRGNVIAARERGVQLEADAHGVTVGGPTGAPGSAPGNRIEVGSPGVTAGGWGVVVSGDGNTVAGNAVLAVGPVLGQGIVVSRGVTETVVGGSSASLGNRVAGFAEHFSTGILVDGAKATRVEHNVVGIAADGRTAEPNATGIDVRSAEGTFVDDNVVAGSTLVGVSIEDRTAMVRGNRIGTDASGRVAIPNEHGLSVESAATIGGPHSGSCVSPCNLISGNTTYGVDFARRVPGQTFIGNVVGAAADGTTPLPNGDGVAVEGSVSIGGAAAGEGNIVAFNRGTGVLLRSDGEAAIRGNHIHSNGSLGIDLVAGSAARADGVTPNDTGDGDQGANSLLNHPVIRTVTAGAGGGLQVTGTAASGILSTYTVELFVDRECDPSGYGEGELPAAVATTSALGAFSVAITPVSGYRYLTATVTGPEGTSEFSACFDLAGVGATLRAAAPAGTTRLDVGSSAGLVGRVVAIGSGATAESNFGDRVGSLILARPTRFAHAAGEHVVAVDDTLFVSVDKAVITRSSKLPDVAAFTGRLRVIAGRTVACGDDVTLTLDGATVAQKLPGRQFTRQSDKRCVFVAKTENGIGRLELDLGKGTWNAQVIRRDLERLTNPVDVGLRIGDDEGTETLKLRASGAVWTYVR